MHINWNSRISLPIYEEPWLTDSVRATVREATDDDALAALLHFYEGALVRAAIRDLKEFHKEVGREHEYASGLGVSRPDSPFWEQWCQVNRGLAASLSLESVWAEEAVAESKRALDGLMEESGSIKSDRFRRTPDPDSWMERVIALECELEGARIRLGEAMRQHVQQAHELALKEVEFRTFLSGQGSVSMAQLDAMTPYEFEQAVANLAYRDGYEIVRNKGGSHDLGADVIVLTRDSRKIVFQCKHRQPGSKAVGSRVIQTFNGTARPVHNADVAVAVTNGSFSKPASALAAEQGIYLLCGDQLKRWATWGVPLLAVLGDRSDVAVAA
ncbi:restriction endonuclease [Streptomyces sp. NPDC056084]|uniref:restriction endonuclease n=1 Tax=unclassified Streptomyces TaxID=2593676 RepID=UPI0035E1D4CF